MIVEDNQEVIMSILSSIDTSQHTTPLSAQQFNFNQQTTAQKAETVEKLETPNIAALDKETPKVDLNNYYSNVQAPEFNAETAHPQQTTPPSQAAQASQNLNNAIAAAVTHGMNAQDAVNIQKAKVAYETTMQAAKTSTFQIVVD